MYVRTVLIASSAEAGRAAAAAREGEVMAVGSEVTGRAAAAGTAAEWVELSEKKKKKNPYKS